MKCLCIDPGTSTGITITDGYTYKTELWNLAARAKTKKLPGEPKHFRLLNFWRKLESTQGENIDLIVCEAATGFIRGRSAVEASHKFRAVVELYSAFYGIELVYVEPNDLKEFALGKRSGEKPEMIAAANRLGYVGNDDDCADSYLLAKWTEKYRFF